MRTQAPLPLALFSLFITISLLSPAANAAPVNRNFNITRILASHPSLSTFNHYLTLTHLAGEINRRQTITVLAIDNSAMSSLLDHHYSITTIKNILSLHVLVDYFGAKKLHQITNGTTLVSSMFQATGSADGTSGYVNITNVKGGKVGFAAEDNDGGGLHSFYVKSVDEIPYVISILEISQPLSSAEAEAPTSAPSSINLISIMSKQGCKSFADLLRASKALSSFQENVDGGLTVFCPTDTAVSGFMPKYKNLTESQKVSVLLYHGVPVYQSLQMLRSSNGIINTLATEGASKYDFTVQNDGEDVKLKTKVVTASIVGTLIDQDPFVAYKLDKVLLPKELFKAAAVAEEPAESPKAAGKKKKKGKAAATADAPAGGPDADDSESDDQKAADDENGANGLLNGGVRSVMMVSLSLLVGVFVL